MKFSRLLILLLAVVPLSQAATWTTIDYPGANDTYARSINNVGQVAGYYYDKALEGTAHGFIWSAGTYTAIDFPGAFATWAYGINDSGDIVGQYRVTDANGALYSFLLSGGTFSTLSYPGVEGMVPESINNSGQIVGYYDVRNSGSKDTLVGFELSAGVLTSIKHPWGDTILFGNNALGEGVGQVARLDELPTSGFAYDGTNFLNFTYPDAVVTVAMGLTDRNEIVGYYTDPQFLTSGFLRIRGKYIRLVYPGALYTYATGIDNNDDVVGYYALPHRGWKGFLRTR